jgi:hypothetical protein
MDGRQVYTRAGDDWTLRFQPIADARAGSTAPVAAGPP